MDTFKWGPQFLTKLNEVDEQHQRLIDVINHFGNCFSENTIQSEVIESVFAELSGYAEYHFEEEERLMAEVRVDPRHVEEHTADHKSFLYNVGILHKQLNPASGDGAEGLLEYLVHWLVYHILGSDQKMARQIFSIREGLDPAAVYEREEHETNASTEPLLAALKTLFQQVSIRNKDLIELNRTLEERVAARTEELQRTNTQLEIIAMTDALTELPNRRHAMLQLQQLWHETQRSRLPLSCMMIDADGFKAINDTYGHDAGDIVLKRLANELRHRVRTDDLVCRLGGDEFLVICPNTDLHGACHLAEQIRSMVARLRVQAGKDGHWQGSISVGVAVSTPEMTSIDTLLKIADDGVYMAKHAGRNCVRSASRADTVSHHRGQE